MGDITALNTTDPRIRQEFDAAFPGSPEFCHYLAGQVMRQRGSLTVARLMIQSLQACLGSRDAPVCVTKETVERLAVQNDILAIGRINNAIVRRGFEISNMSVVFCMRLLADVDPQTKTWSPRAGVDEKRCELYLHIFYCAFAMLIDIKFDPRSIAA